MFDVRSILLTGLVATSVLGVTARADTDGHAKVLYVNVATDGSFYFGLDRAACGGEQGKKHIGRVAADAPGREMMLSVVLAARLSGATVLVGAGSRDDWGCTARYVELW